MRGAQSPSAGGISLISVWGFPPDWQKGKGKGGHLGCPLHASWLPQRYWAPRGDRQPGLVFFVGTWSHLPLMQECAALAMCEATIEAARQGEVGPFLFLSQIPSICIPHTDTWPLLCLLVGAAWYFPRWAGRPSCGAGCWCQRCFLAEQSCRGKFYFKSEAGRAAGIARLPRSLLDPELFPHTAYVKILATLARKTVNWGCQQRATH